jgi:hypothetical protein
LFYSSSKLALKHTNTRGDKMGNLIELITKPFKEVGSQSGMALPEVMLSIFIVGSALTGTVIKMGDISEVQRSQEAIMKYNQIGASISSTAVTLPTLFKSAHDGKNNKLKNCLNEDGSPNCSGQSISFDLFDNVSRIAGGNTPVYLNYDGSICNPDNKDAARLCAFEVTSKFTPICGTTGDCDVAQSLLVDVSLKAIKEISKTKTPTFWADKNSPDELNFSTEVTVSINEFLKEKLGNQSSQNCPLDKALNDALQTRSNQIANADTSGAKTDPWDGTQYRQVLRGISLSGKLICEPTGITNLDAPVMGPTGNRGSTGNTGPKGPKGPSGC